MKILITGGTGLIGSNLYREWRERNDLIFTVHRREGNFGKSETVELDLRFPNIVKESALKIEPTHIIHTAAVTNAEKCKNDPRSSGAINIDSTAALAEAAAEMEVPFYFLSTDLVFDGRKGDYSEDDEPNPLNLYGRQKVEAENAIFSIYPKGSTVLRLALCFGIGYFCPRGFTESMLNKWSDGEKTPLFSDQFRTPIFTGDVVRAFQAALENPQPGLYHLGGPERISRLNMGLKIAEVFGLSPELIHSAKMKEAGLPESRPPDCSLDSSKFQNTFNWKQKSLEENCIIMREHWNGKYKSLR